MPENKKPVVIRVNLAKNNTNTNIESPHRMVTEWNYGRLALVAGLLLELVFVFYGIFTGSDTASETAAEVPRDAPVVIRQAIEPISSPRNIQRQGAGGQTKEENTRLTVKQKRAPAVNAVLLRGVTRARLAQGVANREPFGQVEQPVKVNKDFAVGVFYFTELSGMKGQTVSHRWKRKGKVIFEKKKVILGDRWRTYTSKLLTAYSTGSWVVELINEDGVPLHVIEFEVVMK